MVSDSEDSFLTEVTAQKQASGTRCWLCLLLRDLRDTNPGLAAQIEQALAAPQNRFPASAIGRALRARGYTIPDISVRRHRTGNCGKLV